MPPSESWEARGTWFSLRSLWIALHFAWTLTIAATVFPIGSWPFEVIVLSNAGMAATIAGTRGESWRAHGITLWDEVAAFIVLIVLTLHF